MAASKSFKGFSKMFLDYKPPKELRAMFIVHYAPLLLIIMIGPLTALYGVWKLPIDFVYSLAIGLIVFLIGAFVYLKWEFYWEKTYKGN